MAARRTVVVYGTSLFTTRVETRLQNQPEIDVLQVNTLQSDAVEHLTILRPRVIIVDETESAGDVAMIYLMQHPATLILALDPRTSTMLVLRGQQAPLPSMQHLMDAIEQQIGLP
jgi:ABC-type antimicrobial peptide transport system ATPase subunit